MLFNQPIDVLINPLVSFKLLYDLHLNTGRYLLLTRLYSGHYMATIMLSRIWIKHKLIQPINS